MILNLNFDTIPHWWSIWKSTMKKFTDWIRLALWIVHRCPYFFRCHLYFMNFTKHFKLTMKYGFSWKFWSVKKQWKTSKSFVSQHRSKTTFREKSERQRLINDESMVCHYIHLVVNKFDRKTKVNVESLATEVEKDIE